MEPSTKHAEVELSVVGEEAPQNHTYNDEADMRRMGKKQQFQVMQYHPGVVFTTLKQALIRISAKLPISVYCRLLRCRHCRLVLCSKVSYLQGACKYNWLKQLAVLQPSPFPTVGPVA